MTITTKETSNEEKLNLLHLLSEKTLAKLGALVNVKDLDSKGFKPVCLSKQELNGTEHKC